MPTHPIACATVLSADRSARTTGTRRGPQLHRFVTDSPQSVANALAAAYDAED